MVQGLLASLGSGLYPPGRSAQMGVPGPQKDIKGPQHQIGGLQTVWPCEQESKNTRAFAQRQGATQALCAWGRAHRAGASRPSPGNGQQRKGRTVRTRRLGF